MPFVAWLEEQAKDRPVVVTSLTISDYLQQCNRFKTGQSYDRAGAAIVQFVNQFVNDKVYHKKGTGFDLRGENVNLPEQYVQQIDQWLRDRLTVIKLEAAPSKLRREVSRLLGK